jgi:predicted PhzF superfamily epimerase YddE/YHI9
MVFPLIQVDAFTAQPFAGNPAAVCVLPAPQDEGWMQQVAAEMNLSETAFLVPQTDGYTLRWFTPTSEVDLCGHATLASAHVLWTEGHLSPDAEARFHSRSGLLTAQRRGDWIELNFPAIATTPTDLRVSLDLPIVHTAESSLGVLIEVDSPNAVRQFRPDFTQLKTVHEHGIILTSRGDGEYDFISRYFAPNFGIDEDPVTGSAHCCLATYWRDRLQKSQFLAYQASGRGGVVNVQIEGDRVLLQGQAVTVMRGSLLA